MLTLTMTEFSRYKLSNLRRETSRPHKADDGTMFQKCCKRVRYEDLLSALETGSVLDLKLFPTFKLNINVEDNNMDIINCIVDFTIDFSYVIDGETIYEIYDTKNHSPSWFSKILKEVEYQHGVKINFVSYDKL